MQERCRPRLVRLLALIVCSVPLAIGAKDSNAVPYRKLILDERFYGEGAAFGDLNNDGYPDVVSGPFWWEGPDFKIRHEFLPALPFDPHHYSDNFAVFIHDFNTDGWNDILVLGFPGFDASWFANPGAGGGLWRRTVAFAPVDNESPTFGRLLGDDRPPVLICMSNGVLGYVTWQPERPGRNGAADRPWTFHAVSPPMGWERFTHGLGWGDIDGDGRSDIVEKDGWWEQPASLEGDPLWKRHAFPFAGTDPKAVGGAQMFVYDVNRDGKADVITGKDAHGFGLSWYEQTRDASGTIGFKEHRITSSQAGEKIGGVQFSGLHALALADVDGDGLMDILTGKRWWAHGPQGDAQSDAPPVLYAFLLRRSATGAVRFIPHLIDDTLGIGTQICAVDVDADGRADIVTANKRGSAVFLSLPRGVNP